MEYRMYCLAERHLSPVQKAIQSAHAIVELIGHTTPMDEYAKSLAQWMDEDKTIIILDGGNSDEMMTCLTTLKDNHIPFAEFHESDMGGFLTAICFLVDERAWNYDVYGRSYEEYNCRCYLESGMEHLDYNGWIDKIGGVRGKIIKEMISTRRLAV